MFSPLLSKKTAFEHFPLPYNAQVSELTWTQITETKFRDVRLVSTNAFINSLSFISLHYPSPYRGRLLRAPPPLRFFEDTEKTAARSAIVFFFCVPYQPSFSHLSWEYCLQIISGQVIRSGQVTPPPKKFVMQAIFLSNQFLSNQYETFRIS